MAAIAAAVAAGCAPSSQPQRVQWIVMGTEATISFRGESEDRHEVREAVAGVYDALNAKLSAWDASSELSEFARSGSDDLSKVSPEVRPCYEAAFRLARESGGAFNPRLGAKLRELGFTRVSNVDLGAIAKGFAVDMAYDELARAGYAKRQKDGALLLDLGGNLRSVAGSWRTGVRNPFAALDENSQTSFQPPHAAVLVLEEGEAVATSGNYERFVEKDGKRVSHILDGRTGKPVEGIAGVTVVARSAMMADGLSTTLFVLGPKRGMEFLSSHYPGTAALWIPDSPDSPQIIATPSMGARLLEPAFPVSDASITSSCGQGQTASTPNGSRPEADCALLSESPSRPDRGAPASPRAASGAERP